MAAISQRILGLAVLAFAACGPDLEGEHDTTTGSPEPSTSDDGDDDGTPMPTATTPESDDGAPGEDDEGEVCEGDDCGCCEEYFHLVLPDLGEAFEITLAPYPPKGDWPDEIVVACPSATVIADGRDYPNARVTCEAEAITLRTRESVRPPQEWAITIGEAMPFDASATCTTGETCDCDGCEQELCELVPWPDTATTSGTTSADTTSADTGGTTG